MPLADDTLIAIQTYVEIRATAFHFAYQWLKERKYSREECQQFATHVVTLMFMDTATVGPPEARLKALMQAMTPGGQA